MLSSVYAILNEPRMFKKPHFQLFVVSYADLFNHDDSACSNMTFGIWGGKQPKLTRELRIAIDSVIDEGRKLYDRYLNHLIIDPRVKFLNADAALEGHRFCEPTPENTLEAMNAKAWLYNLEWPRCVPYAMGADEDGNATATVPGFCRNCGGFSGLGDFQRPFHPKFEAHKAYKDFLIEVLKRELM
jgi:hypothetical protein